MIFGDAGAGFAGAQGPAHDDGAEDVGDGEDGPPGEAELAEEDDGEEHADAPGPGHSEEEGPEGDGEGGVVVGVGSGVGHGGSLVQGEGRMEGGRMEDRG